MVVEIDNPANRSMHYGSDRVLVHSIELPERLPQKVVYSNQEANQAYNRIEQDIYEGQRKAKPISKTKFPTVLKILGGAIALAAVIFKGKDILKMIKNIFKK